LTNNQRCVLEALRQERGPLSAYALLARLREDGITAPTQIYRALERLARNGLVHRLETLNAYISCSRGCRHGSVAFAICDQCGHIDEFAEDELDQVLERWARCHRFLPERTTIEIHGRCAACNGLFRSAWT
jgi:Fur family zinc uptake transcriptional regulator